MGEMVHLRKASSKDDAFLLDLYCDVRLPEISSWGWSASQCDAFLQMQHQAQLQSYRSMYPLADNYVVCRDDMQIGRLLTARTEECLYLVDIAILSAYRNCGVGTRLMLQLMQECEGTQRAIHLQVLRTNPAMNLYRRLGFREADDGQMYIKMRWHPVLNQSALMVKEPYGRAIRS